MFLQLYVSIRCVSSSGAVVGLGSMIVPVPDHTFFSQLLAFTSRVENMLGQDIHCLESILDEHGECYWDKDYLCIMLFYNKVSKGAKIRNRYNQVPHLTQDTNGKVTNSQ